MMELAIVYAASVFALAYVLPKLWMIQAQERLVQIQVDALTAAPSQETPGGNGEIDWHTTVGPYA